MIRLAVNIDRKVYAQPETVVLAALRFAVAAGELLAIVGPSGAGKTTLLNIIGGLDRHFEGEVKVHDVAGSHRANGIRMGYMFQTPRLLPWLTVLDNVLLVLGADRENRALAGRLLREVGLAGYEDAFPGQLSGGMQRRVALVRAFAVRPALLLLDEPFVSLDAPTAAELRGQLYGLRQWLKPTVLYVTHDLHEALAVADRVLFLSARPARVVLEHAVDVAGSREVTGGVVEHLAARLLAQHPSLLSGRVSHPQAGNGSLPTPAPCELPSVS